MKIIQESFFDGFKSLSPIFNQIPEEEVQLFPKPLLHFFQIITDTNQKTVSLTDSQKIEDQLRYFTAERMDRYYDLLSRTILKHVKISKIEYHCFKYENKSVVKLIKYLTKNIKIVIESELNKNEKCLLKSQKEQIIHERLHAGDSFFVIQALKIHKDLFSKSEQYRLIGIASALQNNTKYAEKYLLKWAEHSSAIHKAWAYYSLAMLYARHHHKKHLSLTIAENYLEKSYKILIATPITDENSNELDFSKIFNRNGLALIYFKKNKILEAIELLNYGIKKLKTSKSKYKLHKSVLIYNRSQCWNALGNIKNAIKDQKLLVKIDPNYAENRLELSKLLSSNCQFNKALNEVEIALRLDASIKEAYALKAKYLLENNDYKKSIQFYEIYLNFTPNDHEIKIEYTEALLKNKNIKKAEITLQSLHYKKIPSSHLENYFTLKSELYLRRNKTNNAIKTITTGLKHCPKSLLLKENLGLLERSLS